jgi:arylsulfatase A-like enzyme
MIILDGTRCDAIDKVPYFQELKKESVFFSSSITYAPYTVASLHSIFSGMYGNLNGIDGYYKIYDFDKKHCFTLPQYLKEQGYHTETDTAWKGSMPLQGFDNYRVHDEHKIDFLERHTEILHRIKHKNPFFLTLHYGKTHTSLVTNFIKKYSDFDKEYFNNKNKNFESYLGWVEESGNYLKGIIEKIKECGLYDNSIILIFSDHGSSTGDRIGEKAYGVYLYDYTIKCFMYLIGKNMPKNMEIGKLIRSIDLLPTILDLAKLKEKKGYKPIRGKSFLPFVYGKTDDRMAYSETGGLGGPTPSPDKPNVKSIRTNKWKLIYNETNKKKELYDLEMDKEEKNNLIGTNPDVEDNLWKEMMKFQETNKPSNTAD